MLFLRSLRLAMKKYGKENIVYFDESGFVDKVTSTYGWAKKGEKIFAKVPGKRQKRINLIMAQRGKDWLAPILFQGTCDHKLVTKWVKEHLIKELSKPSVIVMDNAPFHNKKDIQSALEEKGHILMPLPTYSPDLNPIEQSFAIIKRKRIYSDMTLEEIITRQ